MEKIRSQIKQFSQTGSYDQVDGEHHQHSNGNDVQDSVLELNGIGHHNGQASANGENGSDADVSSLSSLDGIEESQLPAIESLKRLASYRRLQSTCSTVEDRQSSVCSSCDGRDAIVAGVEDDKFCNGGGCCDIEPGEGAKDMLEVDDRPQKGQDLPFVVEPLKLAVENGEGACPCTTVSTPGSPEAVLNLNAANTPNCNHCRPFPVEDMHEFSSNSSAAVTCELKTDAAHPFARLQEELRRAQEELKIKDEEVGRLKCLRDEVGAELEDLTASLFQEAHKMVREAKVKRDAAEKALKEANMKIEVLQAEVQALKALVITSTPSMPNRHLHPQIDSKGNPTKENGEKNGVPFLKGHKRSPSHNNLKYGRETTPPGSPVREPPPEPLLREEYGVDPVYHHEFVLWKENPTLDKSHPFLARIYREDILPCLNFANTELAKEVQKCIEENSIVIETVSGKSPFPKRCAMLDTPRLCKYRMKLGDSDQWYYISELCRNRIAATCNFLSYLRYIQQGLVKSSIHEVYGEILRLRKQIALAKLGFN